MYPPKVVLIKFNETMFVKTCDICGKEVVWKEYVGVSYSAEFARYEFCERCGASVVAFLKENGLLKEEKSLRKF